MSDTTNTESACPHGYPSIDGRPALCPCEHTISTYQSLSGERRCRCCGGAARSVALAGREAAVSDTPNVRRVGHYAKRLRARIGLRLVRPWLHHRKQTAYWHAVNSDEPNSCHGDWWLGQYLALEHLEQDLDRGRSSDE